MNKQELYENWKHCGQFDASHNGTKKRNSADARKALGEIKS
jgi:hypothetical protein